MSLNDTLSNALSLIMNAERVSKKQVIIKPASKVIEKVLNVIKDNHFIGDIKRVKDERGDYLIVDLLGRINKCGAIKPRFPITKKDYEKYEKQYLPAKDFGIIVVSTSSGIMIHTEGKKKSLGGKLLAYCY
ncbi:MAG: 30S ribosomal protein S8 [Nanoarchaeota archaeon]|nr:30S ribosomal protein S8 [Nanoarchaeota archaeon]MBU1704438.1 30S ribosomal protein S8 [Nanoarchaeota archaeon]